MPLGLSAARSRAPDAWLTRPARALVQAIGTAGPAAARHRPVADHAVVVGQLLAPTDVASGPDPDRLVDDFEVAVRVTRVVDEPRDVAADVRVAAPDAVDAEDPEFALCAIGLLARVACVVVADQVP